jgi:hypothetical protein
MGPTGNVGERNISEDEERTKEGYPHPDFLINGLRAVGVRTKGQPNNK